MRSSGDRSPGDSIFIPPGSPGDSIFIPPDNRVARAESDILPSQFHGEVMTTGTDTDIAAAAPPGGPGPRGGAG